MDPGGLGNAGTAFVFDLVRMESLFDAATETFAWGAHLSSLPGGGGQTAHITLDLNDLPPDSSSILDRLNDQGRLDVAIQDDSEVDFLDLWGTACGPPKVLEMDQGPLVSMTLPTFTATGCPSGSTVYFIRSFNGAGSFSTSLRGWIFLQPAQVIISTAPEVLGTATFTLPSPIPVLPPNLHRLPFDASGDSTSGPTVVAIQHDYRDHFSMKGNDEAGSHIQRVGPGNSSLACTFSKAADR